MDICTDKYICIYVGTRIFSLFDMIIYTIIYIYYDLVNICVYIYIYIHMCMYVRTQVCACTCIGMHRYPKPQIPQNILLVGGFNPAEKY